MSDGGHSETGEMSEQSLATLDAMGMSELRRILGLSNGRISLDLWANDKLAETAGKWLENLSVQSSKLSRKSALKKLVEKFGYGKGERIWFVQPNGKIELQNLTVALGNEGGEDDRYFATKLNPNAALTISLSACKTAEDLTRVQETSPKSLILQIGGDGVLSGIAYGLEPGASFSNLRPTTTARNTDSATNKQDISILGQTLTPAIQRAHQIGAMSSRG